MWFEQRSKLTESLLLLDLELEVSLTLTLSLSDSLRS